MVTIQEICKITGVSSATAGLLANQLIELDILKETTGYARNRKLLYQKYFDILKKGVETK